MSALQTDRTKSLTDDLAERAVLGYVQMFPAALADVCEIVTHEHFANPAHGPIFEALRVVIERDGEVSYAALASELHARRVYNAVGGVQYVSDCAMIEDEYGFAITPSGAMTCARLVADLATRRALFDAARRIAQKALDLTADAGEVSDFATGALTTAVASTALRAGRTFGAAVEAVVMRMGDPARGRASFPLPWPALNGRLGGLRRKRLHILAGRPAMGKSALALNIGLALSAPRAWWPERDDAEIPEAVPVLMFALEMGDEENAARGIGTLAGVTASRFESGVMPEEDQLAVSFAVTHTAAAPMMLDDKTRSVARMRTVARQFFGRHGKGVLVVDYLQLCKSTGLDVEKGANRERHVAAMTAEFKAMAMDLDVAVLLLAQLNRTAAADEDKPPRMENLRESGAAEQDADVILLLWGKRPGAGDLTQEVNVRVEKVRGGAAGGDVPMIFTRRITRFSETTGPRAESDEYTPCDTAPDDFDNPGGYRVGGYSGNVVPMRRGGDE